MNCSSVNGFLLSGQCAIQPNCSCKINTIRCDYSFHRPKLAQIPVFVVRSYHFSKIEIDFGYNQLSVIPSHAFSNLSGINATDIEMGLYHNHIYQIDTSAFYGIEIAVTVLNLESNNLSHLPKALADLRVISLLKLKHNPLINLDVMVMAKLGESLNTFEFSLNRFASFPYELQYLKTLQILTMDNIPFKTLPPNGFRAFESTLIWLELSHSQLETVPASFCHLPNLQWFEFNFNENLYINGTLLFDNCHHNILSNLRLLSLKGNNLTSLPNLSGIFPNLRKLVLTDNKLNQISTISLPDNLIILELKDNLFHTIPLAINKLSALTELHISGNNITAVNDNDLKGLRNLTAIHLDNTLISYVSPNAFAHNPKLVSLSFDYTKLDRVPDSLLALSKLTWLHLPNYRINCTCNEMSYLHKWNPSSIHILGECRPSSRPNHFKTLSQFIKHDLQQCP